MRLKDLIFALETHKIDPTTGHAVIGERPEIPWDVEDQMVGVVFYVGHDKMSDHKLLNTAKVAVAKFGNIPVIQKGSWLVTLELEEDAPEEELEVVPDEKPEVPKTKVIPGLGVVKPDEPIPEGPIVKPDKEPDKNEEPGDKPTEKPKPSVAPKAPKKPVIPPKSKKVAAKKDK